MGEAETGGPLESSLYSQPNQSFKPLRDLIPKTKVGRAERKTAKVDLCYLLPDWGSNVTDCFMPPPCTFPIMIDCTLKV